MNRKETRLLVENWRNLLSEGYVSQDEELLNEGIVKNLLTAIPFLLSAYTANVSDALDTNEIQQIVNSSMPAGIKGEVSEDGTTLTLTKGETTRDYDINPDTSHFSPRYNNYIKSQIGDLKSLRSFIKGDQNLPGSIGTEGESENLFLPGITGAKFEKGLTKENEDLINKITDRFVIENAEIYTNSDGKLVLVGYDDTNQPQMLVNFDPDQLEGLCNAVDKDAKRTGERNHARDLRKSLINFNNGLPLPY